MGTRVSLAIAECKVCKTRESTGVCHNEIEMWVMGDEAQTVWPQKSAQEREIVMQSQYARLLNRPFPGPYYICGSCSDKFEEE